MITAVAGVAWTQWGASGVTGAASGAIRVVGILIGLVILIWCGRRWRRPRGGSETTSGALPGPRSRPIFSSAGFLVVNAVQVVAFAGGARLLAATGHPEYLIAWVATVVGVHFLAFGRLFLTGFYWLGAALITARFAGVLVGVAGGGPAGIKVTSGLMAAASLFAAGGWSIAWMRSRSHAWSNQPPFTSDGRPPRDHQHKRHLMTLRLLYRGPTIEVLHEQYAKQGHIDARAPVQAIHSVHIGATPQRVWQVLSTATDWPSVDPAISNVQVTGGVAVDAPFTWTNGKARIRSRFAVVDPVRELTWTGQSSGAKAVHRHVLHQADGNATRLDSEESMAGPFLTLFYNSAKLDHGLGRWLTAVKSVAERHP